MKEGTGLLEVNQPLVLQFVEGDPAAHYASRVDDIRDNQFYIAWPTDSGVQVPVHRGDFLKLSFTREDALYELDAKVDSTQGEPQPILIVRGTGPILRNQRRENVRVRVSLPMELVGSMLVEGQASPVPLRIKTNVLDFSGGGFSFQHKEAIPSGTILESRFSLPSNPDPFKLGVKVMRCTLEVDLRGGQSHRIGLMFLGMHESVRSRLVRYVFGAQNTVIRR